MSDMRRTGSGLMPSEASAAVIAAAFAADLTAAGWTRCEDDARYWRRTDANGCVRVRSIVSAVREAIEAGRSGTRAAS